MTRCNGKPRDKISAIEIIAFTMTVDKSQPSRDAVALEPFIEAFAFCRMNGLAHLAHPFIRGKLTFPANPNGVYLLKRRT